MATSLCASIGKNTGAINCDVRKAVPKILVIGGASFSPEVYANSQTMDAAILAKFNLANGTSQKLFPFPLIQTVTNQTEAAKFATFGLGLKIKTAGSRPAYEFDVLAGSTLEKQLLEFDGQQVPILVLDTASQFWGIKDLNGNFIGSQWLISVEPHPYADGTNTNPTKVNISIVDPDDFSKNAFTYKTSISTSLITGLKDVVMSVLSHTTNVYKIKLEVLTAILGKKLDLWEDIGAAVAALTFTGKKPDGTALTITSAAADETLDAITLTVDSTMHTAIPTGETFTIIPPSVSDLVSADITGFEIGSLAIVK